jgi:hypothetical protein
MTSETIKVLMILALTKRPFRSESRRTASRKFAGQSPED